MEDNRYDFEEIKEQVPITTLLRRLGYEPLRYSGGEHFYHSMLRDGDRIPSFCVNDKLGLWYDHGLGKGGTVIDFAKAYWPQHSFREAVSILLSTMNLSRELEQPKVREPRQLEIPLRHPSYKVIEDRPLGGNQKITDYLLSRGIYGPANENLREVYYWVKPEGKQRMSFSAAGWQNDLGGWEVRSAGFKGCLGQKGINTIFVSPDKISLFEGMMDYLSWKTIYPANDSSVIVLNSLSMLPRAVSTAMNFSEIDIFFDHDQAGRKATLDLLIPLPHAVDRSWFYEGYNDYNEKLQAITIMSDSLRVNENLNKPLRNR